MSLQHNNFANNTNTKLVSEISLTKNEILNSEVESVLKHSKNHQKLYSSDRKDSYNELLNLNLKSSIRENHFEFLNNKITNEDRDNLNLSYFESSPIISNQDHNLDINDETFTVNFKGDKRTPNQGLDPVKDDRPNNLWFDSIENREHVLRLYRDTLKSSNIQQKVLLLKALSKTDNDKISQDFKPTNNVNSSNSYKQNEDNLLLKQKHHRFVENVISDFCQYLHRNNFKIVQRDCDINILDNNVGSEDLYNNGGYLSKNSKFGGSDKIRTKRAWLCPHFDKVHYAHGKCQTCYSKRYYKVKGSSSKVKPNKGV